MRTQKKVEHCFEDVQKCKVRQIGEIEAQPEKKGIKTEWVYNGWVNFFGIGDCNRAKRRIQKKPHKYGQMKIEKVGSIRILGFDAKNKYVQIPRFRVPAKEKVPRQYFIWGKRLSAKSYSKFAVDKISSLISNVVLVY